MLLILSVGAQAYSIENLLGEYAQKGDLSVQTKKESAGYLIIFTRSDLDRMKIKSLKELINYIPFLRYNENASGLSDVNYTPYQTYTFNPVIIYLDDRQMTAPFSGNGFQLLGQLDMGYIDHVDVYLGIPSYEIGFNTAATVIKLYTKKGYRENATVAGASYASRGTNDEYLYQGRGMDGYSYFLYLDHRGLKREKIHKWSELYKRDYSFSKDKDTLDFYGEIENRNLRLESQVVAGTMHNFIGKSWDMTTQKNKTRFRYLYGGIYYTSDDKDFRASINYSQTFSNNRQVSDSPLGMLFTSNPPFIYTYNRLHVKLKESLSDLKILKNFTFDKEKLFFGFRYRYKGFKFRRLVADDAVDLPRAPYDREYVISGYAENHYSLNAGNMLVGSFKLEKHVENGGIRNFSTYGGRLGYIFNDRRLTIKNFFFFGAFAPSPYILYHQRLLGKSRVSVQKALALSGELIYRLKNSICSVKLLGTRMRKVIRFTREGYVNTGGVGWLEGVAVRYTHWFDPFNKIILNGWYYKFSANGIIHNLLGGFVALFNHFGKFDLFNSLSYRGIMQSHKPSFNLNSVVTYNATRNLTLYIKGENLLNKAITVDYYRFDPLKKKLTALEKVPVFDRRVWLGVEYKF